MVQSIRFLKSAVLPQDYPMGNKAEIALAGRSNAGKSSYINSLAKNGKLAKISQVPGKTRLLNFFEIGENYRLVDMPGYGYASRSGDEILEWQKMIENYITTRGNLVGLLLLMDIRREWSVDEKLLHDFMNSVGKPLILVLTKMDKITPGEAKRRINLLKKASGVSFAFAVSATKNIGIEEVEEHVFKNWVKPYKLGVING